MQLDYNDFKMSLCLIVQEILSGDANNYNALIFQGSALAHLQRFGEALESYRKAGEADPSQVLAWQVATVFILAFESVMFTFSPVSHCSEIVFDLKGSLF